MVSVLPMKYCVELDELPDEELPEDELPEDELPEDEPPLTELPPGRVKVAPLVENVIILILTHERVKYLK